MVSGFLAFDLGFVGLYGIPGGSLHYGSNCSPLLCPYYHTSHPFKEDQEIPRMDWEDFIRIIRVQIMKAQTPESYVEAQLFPFSFFQFIGGTSPVSWIFTNYSQNAMKNKP
jgi:hypothetical protein